jgi:hypothetical protein
LSEPFFEKIPNASFQLVHIFGIFQQPPLLSMMNDPARPIGETRDDRESARQSFKDCQGASVIKGGMDKKVRGSVVFFRFVGRSRKNHLFPNSQFPGSADIRFFSVSPQDQESDRRMAFFFE